MKTGHKVLIGVGAVGVGAALVFALSGDANAATRGPWKKPLDLPSTEEEWQEVRTAICTCSRGGAGEGKDLLVCVLSKIYAAVPWGPIADSGPVTGDHPSVLKAIDAIGSLVLEYEGLPDEAAREQWCEIGEGPEVLKPIGKAEIKKPEPKGPTIQELRKKKLEELLSDEVRGGVLWIPKHNKYPNNISDTARAMLLAEGVEPTSKLVAALAFRISCPMWNMPYKRIHAGDDETTPDYFFCSNWIVRPAYLPRHADPVKWVLEGKRPPKLISNTGAGKSTGFYGMLWLPAFDVEMAKSLESIVITQPEPPDSFLELLD